MHLRLRRIKLRSAFQANVKPRARLSQLIDFVVLLTCRNNGLLSRKLGRRRAPLVCGYLRRTSLVLKKVLIVDDSPAQVKLMQGLLEHEGYQPFGLNDPLRVEETINTIHPSLILLDVVMPERNGFQVCRELKGSAQFQSIPVILVTSKDTASDKYWGEQQGADAYVTKPFTREELLRAVRRFV